MIEWLDIWHSDSEHVGLTKDTYNTRKRCSQVLIDLLNIFLWSLKLNIFYPRNSKQITWKSDLADIEIFLGVITMCLIQKILESEKKSCTTESLNELRSTFDDGKILDVSDFIYIFETEYLAKYHIDESVQFYVCGYAAHFIQKRVDCISCRSLVIEKKENEPDDDYFQYLLLKKSILYIITFALFLSLFYVTKPLRKNFWVKKDHKNLLASLGLSSLEQDNFLIDFNVSVGHLFKIMYMFVDKWQIYF